MTHLFIINPAAGNRDHTEYFRKTIERICGSRGLTYRIAVSQASGNCRDLARQAAETGEEYRIYACGGDGTLNEVVSGVVGFSNVAVTHFAGGSGNDFVKIFGDVAPFRDLSRLLDCEESQFDLIRCNDSWALNMCTVGLDSRVGADVAKYKRFPFVSGSGAYLLSTLANVIKGISEHYVVEIAGETLDSRQTMVVAMSGRYYGGGFNPVPEADPADGLLDVLLVKPVTRLQVAGVVNIYKQGRYRELPHIVRHLRTDSLRIHCDKPTCFNLDGELVTAQDMDICIAPKKLRFFYPKGLVWQHAPISV